MLQQICPNRGDPHDEVKLLDTVDKGKSQSKSKNTSTDTDHNVNNCDLQDEKQNVNIDINIQIRNKMLLEQIQQTRNAFVNFITKYLYNSQTKLAATLKNSSIEQLQSYLKKHGIQAKP